MPVLLITFIFWRQIWSLAFQHQSGTSNIQHPASSIQHPASSIQHPASSIQHPASSIQHPASNIQHHPWIRGGGDINYKKNRIESSWTIQVVQWVASREEVPLVLSRQTMTRYSVTQTPLTSLMPSALSNKFDSNFDELDSKFAALHNEFSSSNVRMQSCEAQGTALAADLNALKADSGLTSIDFLQTWSGTC
jgi:hypothetical protein